jgi:hypothetical protein
MHTGPMAESEGDLSKAHKSPRPCRKCKRFNVSVQTWESHCGGYEDLKFTCLDCKAVWWIDGIDS